MFFNIIFRLWRWWGTCSILPIICIQKLLIDSWIFFMTKPDTNEWTDWILIYSGGELENRSVVSSQTEGNICCQYSSRKALVEDIWKQGCEQWFVNIVIHYTKVPQCCTGEVVEFSLEEFKCLSFHYEYLYITYLGVSVIVNVFCFIYDFIV